MFFGSKYPTSSANFENLWNIDIFQKEQLDCDDPIIKNMVVEIRAKVDKYWSEYTLGLFGEKNWNEMESGLESQEVGYGT